MLPYPLLTKPIVVQSYHRQPVADSGSCQLATGMQAADIECDRITSSDSSRQGNRVTESEPVIDATGIGINGVWSTQQVLLQAHPPAS